MAHGKEFQLEQLGRIPLSEAQLSATALEPQQSLGLEFLQRLALHQQRPRGWRHERPEAALCSANEWTQGRAGLQQRAWR
ncbi:hypothetical protein Q664_00435 [Archangium violaceum Cb vi76]|uniref:Uncharacterized protein n=1 Tax=Archangium violaceum Cb vi76 TaxID=1406225 RepID=A0A084T2C6_9BACT|nr:hypothetical protein Q664_00435 [Archangium violaceum Cb vi76]